MFLAHPLSTLLHTFPADDFIVMSHGVHRNHRDYQLVVQYAEPRIAGTFSFQFTHCVLAEYKTALSDNLWKESWADVFASFNEWEKADFPPGHVWDAVSVADPGFIAVEQSEVAADFSERLGHPMFEALLETVRFSLRLVFHSITHLKINDDDQNASRITIPIKNI